MEIVCFDGCLPNEERKHITCSEVYLTLAKSVGRTLNSLGQHVNIAELFDKMMKKHTISSFKFQRMRVKQENENILIWVKSWVHADILLSYEPRVQVCGINLNFGSFIHSCM